MAIDQEFLKSIGLDDESVISKIAEKSVEDEKGLLSKRDELLGTVNKYKTELEQAAALKTEYEQLQKKLKERENESLTEEERIKRAREEASQEWEGKYSEAAQKLEQLTMKERERVRNEAIFRAVGDKGDGELILDVVAQRGLVSVELDSEGNNVLKVKSLDGKELESIDKLMEEMKANERYSRLWNSSGLSGGGSRNSSGKTGQTDPKLFGAAKMRAARGG